MDTVTTYFDRLATEELTVDEPLTFESKWTPVKRLNVVRDSMPEEARSSTAWMNTFAGIIRGRSHRIGRTDVNLCLLRSSQSETGLEASC